MNTISRRGFLVGSLVGVGTLTTGTAVGRSERYVVGTTDASTSRAVARRATTVAHVLDFGPYGHAVAGTFPAAALDGLRRRPGVRYVERDAPAFAVAQTLPWGVDRVDAEVAHGAGFTGAGSGGPADVAIIDTGIDSDHPDLAAALGDGIAVVAAKGNYAEPWDDDNGHGTHCAGIAAAVDDDGGVVGTGTGATLHAVKVLRKNGSGWTSDIAAGLTAAADRGWDVGSMSLGASTGTRSLREACAYAYADGTGMVLVAAAGNDGGPVGYPAAYDTVLAVSATDRTDRLASWSNRGPEVDLAAPGVGIYATYAGGGYETLSGTSMACPHVTGAAAVLMADGHSAATTRTTLTSTAERLPGLTTNEQGAGLLDLAAAVGLDSSDDLTADVTAPTAPTNLVASGVTDTSVDLSWDAATDTGTGVDHYRVLVDGSAGPTTETTADTVTGLAPETTYDFAVTAVDGAGNESPPSDPVTVTTVAGTGGGSAPTVPDLAVTESADPSPHATFDVSWAVADADGDLDTVTISLTDETAGGTEATTSVSVSGTDDAGTTALRAHKDDGAGHTYAVAVTVTDAAGATATRSTTVTEDGR